VSGLRSFVVEAEVALRDGVDPAAVGGAVTAALCGSWDHEGPCRWPHNNAIDGGRFRTVVVAPEDEAEAVRERIDAGLRGDGRWRVAAVRVRAVADAERDLADRLLAGPRRT
jgi:hypothetical protein